MKNVTVFLLCLLFQAHAHAVNLLGTEFSAPTIVGKSNVYNPMVGDILYDSSDSTFYGRAHDNANNIDVWTALSATSSSSNPVGTVITFAASTCPTGYLPADGKSYSRTGVYATLYGIIATAHGDGTAGGSGEAGCPGAGCFNAPDYRGRFLRGVTGSASTDPDAGSRAAMNTGGNTGNNIGSVQADELKSHNHRMMKSFNSLGSDTITSGYGNNATSIYNFTDNTGGTETRPKNAYVNFCVKY